MNRLVVGNLVHRPLRSLISALAVTIEVVMILSIVAIMLGMVNGQKLRTNGIGGDIIAKPGAASNLIGVSGAPASAKVGLVLAKLPHVKVAAPIYIQLTTSAGAVENIFGIDYSTFNALTPFVFVEGGPFSGPDDIIVDDVASHGSTDGPAMRGKSFHVGETTKLLGHVFHVSGVVVHGRGGRKFIPLDTINAINGTDNRCSVFYLRTEDAPKWQKAVREEIQATEGMQQWDVQTLDELLSQMTPEKFPGFNIGLSVVIGIAVVIGFLVIFQSMYTAVMERTREIGILKSLGASKGYIVGIVLRESGLLAVCGVVAGVASTYLLRAILHIKASQLEFEVTPAWVAKAAAIAIVGALLGALYPALKAASKDPIDALSYE
ncbi:FtsX-like permease family protein [Terriglobus roseus]|uniref:Putative ABC transport system permease protein n=1 Tax=Terriglobus roseus TaxID=392734 RepID=A0A1H4QX41_9BACT|nr:FtsX-like permease family protein [Terriglobus roseus]SEC24206.1 putative ABC transport system permease protein [Terriglobus roseus]